MTKRVSVENQEKYIIMVKDILSNIPSNLKDITTKKEMASYKKFVRFAKGIAKISKSKTLLLLVMKKETAVLEQLNRINKKLLERYRKRNCM